MRWQSAPSPYVLPMTVVRPDIDDQGIASNVAIVGWMVRAAIAHSTAEGVDWACYRRLQAMFVVRRHEIDYHRSARLGERLLLRTWPSFLKAATAHRKHEVLRAIDGTVIARGMNVWAYIDRQTGRPKRIPDEVLQAFAPEKYL